MKISGYLLMLDAAILIFLGVLFLFAPQRAIAVFHFGDLPVAVNYLLGLWGCALLTLAGGYVIAATNPWRHRIWIQIGIARGALEAVFGLICISKGIVSFSQGGLGTIAAAAICVAYILFFPKPASVPK
jgi:hypothetical protein